MSYLEGKDKANAFTALRVCNRGNESGNGQRGMELGDEERLELQARIWDSPLRGGIGALRMAEMNKDPALKVLKNLR